MQAFEIEGEKCLIIQFVPIAISGYWNAAIIVNSLSCKSTRKRIGVKHASSHYPKILNQNRMLDLMKKNMNSKRMRQEGWCAGHAKENCRNVRNVSKYMIRNSTKVSSRAIPMLKQCLPKNGTSNQVKHQVANLIQKRTQKKRKVVGNDTECGNERITRNPIRQRKAKTAPKKQKENMKISDLDKEPEYVENREKRDNPEINSEHSNVENIKVNAKVDV